MTEQFSNRWEEHAKTVSEPAERAKKEGIRRIDCGPASAEYDLALLPDGRIAIQFTCAMASSASMRVPWRAFASRETAVDYFRQEVVAFFQREGKLTKEREAARRKIMGILQPGSLFGFDEPEPGAPPASTRDPVEAAEETEVGESHEEADEPA